MPLSKGDLLGPYEILALVGKGGMGEVYRAHDSRLRRDVAIKVCGEQFDDRFERESRAIAALNHPNICQIYDVGPNYLVMELVEGPTLKERIKEGAIPLDEALRIAGQIADALAAAHEKLITHRDLKPGNVKIKDDGTVKVLDFGLAKLGATPASGESEESPTFTMTLTQSGVILGTAAYMSPEQARGKPVDARSDIWAFGVVLYEMLTGRRLFGGEDLAETLAGVVKETPDLSAAPRKVRRLLEACLHKNPKRRLQAIGDFHYLLVEPERQRTSWFWPAALAGTIALSAAALAWTHFHEASPPLPSLRYQLTRPGETGFAQFQLSPDGRYLAFVSRNDANIRLYIRALDSLEDRELKGTDGATYPFWSPDSAHIGFFSQGQLKVMPLGGGPPISIAEAPDPRGGAWARDDSIVFAPAVSGTLFRVPASGGQSTPLKLPRTGSGQDSLRYPAFLPDSDHFLYTVEAETREGEAVFVGSLSGGPPVRILRDLTATRYVPSPGSDDSGFILFQRQTTLMAQAFDAAKLKTAGDAFPLAEGLVSSGNNGYADFTVSAKGVLIYAAGGNTSQEREITWLGRDGTHGKSIVRQKNITDFALSPDSAKLMYSVANQTVAGDLWLLEMARGTAQRFTFGPYSAYSPVWSPDSATVVFSVYPEDRLYTKKTASPKEEALAVTGTNSYASSWSGDGKLLAFSQSGVTSKDDLWLLPLEGERKPRLFKQTPYAERGAQISPDGRWLVYDSNASGRAEIYIETIAPGGGPRQISVEGGSNPRWRSDGKELFFISDRKMMAIDVKPGPDLTFGASHELFHEAALIIDYRGVAYQPSADGRQFLMVLPVGGKPAALPLTVVNNWQGDVKR